MPKNAKEQTPSTELAAPGTGEPSAPHAEPGDNGQATPAPLTGLRGADYVKALAGHLVSTLQVPLLPIERRGDWGRAKGQKIPVTSRQLHEASAHWLERDHALCGVIVALDRPGATRYEQLPLDNSSTHAAIEHLSDYVNQTRLHAQAQTGKKWTATHVYLIPAEDA
jgi:hypothetical protein